MQNNTKKSIWKTYAFAAKLNSNTAFTDSSAIVLQCWEFSSYSTGSFLARHAYLSRVKAVLEKNLLRAPSITMDRAKHISSFQWIVVLYRKHF